MAFTINDPDYIANLTNQAIPVDPSQPIKVYDLEAKTNWEYGTAAYQAAWADGTILPLVLRHYLSPISQWQTDDGSKSNREWAVLRRLRLDSFPAPRPLAKGDGPTGTYLIWQTPPGQPHLQRSDDIVAATKPFIPQLANLLATLHRLDHNSLNNEPLYHATIAGSLVRMLLWSRGMGNESLRQAVARLKPAVAQMKSWSPRLLHGNPHLGNTLIENNQITVLVNWEHAAIGDPRWDVMTAAHWLRQDDVDLGEQLVNWYETFTGQTIADRLFWWAMVSTRLWALKAWANFAVKQGQLPDHFSTWTTDLTQAEALAFADLERAGL